MKYHKENQKYVIYIARSEDIIGRVSEFCQKEGIFNGFFYGVGAVDEAELAHYSVDNKKYSSFKLTEPLEAVSIIGNVFPDNEGKLIVHTHASFSRPNGEMVGGHLVNARISGVAEILFTPLNSNLSKAFDEVTGLKVLQISES
jgi:hypothetical protein